jgi:hypothetical protein
MKSKSIFFSSGIMFLVLGIFIFLFYNSFTNILASPQDSMNQSHDSTFLVKHPTNNDLGRETDFNSAQESSNNGPWVVKTIFEDPLSYIGTILAILSFIISIFIAWVGFFAFFQFREGRKEIKEFKIFKQKAEEELFKYLDSVKTIEKSLDKNRTFLNQSVENIFDALINYANIKGDKESLQLFFIARALSSLYSFDKHEIFAGIGKLAEIGDEFAIVSLERLVSNLEDEDKDLKNLAEIAIAKIRNRINN